MEQQAASNILRCIEKKSIHQLSSCTLSTRGYDDRFSREITSRIVIGIGITNQLSFDNLVIFQNVSVFCWDQITELNEDGVGMDVLGDYYPCISVLSLISAVLQGARIALVYCFDKTA